MTKKEKIGIVTIVDYTNFGNRLQNYAVYSVMKKNGYRTYTLHSLKEKKYPYGRLDIYIKNEIVKNLWAFPKCIVKKFGAGTLRWVNFMKWSKLIPTKHYYECEHLSEDLNNEYDFFVAGSDQIWNYNFASKKFDDYFLKFATNNKKIALSASFGIEEIPEEWEKTYVDGLKSFKNISVREDAGKYIVNNLIDRDADVLIDPVMMLDKNEWLKVSRKPLVDTSKPYILKYYLGDKTKEDKIDIWAEKKGYETYELLDESNPELYSAGPGEFLSLINNAELVCSDSFHCIVFAIIFSKPFIVYKRIGNENNMLSRLKTLLSKFGFEDRWEDVVQEQDFLQCDFSNVDSIIKKEQSRFNNYLQKCLH